MQTQVNLPRSSRHVPSFMHGWDSHSLMFNSHLGPVNPLGQSQRNEPLVFTHVPPCSHGDNQPVKIQTHVIYHKKEPNTNLPLEGTMILLLTKFKLLSSSRYTNVSLFIIKYTNISLFIIYLFADCCQLLVVQEWVHFVCLFVWRSILIISC